MTDYPAVLRELMIAGYEGERLLAAFERLCKAIGSAVLGAASNAPAKAVVRPLPDPTATPRLAKPAPVVIVPPPENAKAIARKAIAQSMLSPATIALGSHLIERFNLGTGRCDPGASSLAQDLGISVRQVRRSISDLIESGLFGKVRHGGLGHRNAYVPNWPLMVDRAAEGDIAPTVTKLSANGDKVVTQNHLRKPYSHPVLGKPLRGRGGPSHGQRYFPFSFDGGKVKAEEAIREKLKRDFTEHLRPMGKAMVEHAWTNLTEEHWRVAIADEMTRRGAGMPSLLASLERDAPRRFAGSAR